mmetsp:Transcript_149305/g.479431  ORF Transcript_149305/g.479431 Transcript_149305/m.479431 type:complete len:214 (-) Transcript_149305:114-755(-)
MLPAFELPQGKPVQVWSVGIEAFGCVGVQHLIDVVVVFGWQRPQVPSGKLRIVCMRRNLPIPGSYSRENDAQHRMCALRCCPSVLEALHVHGSSKMHRALEETDGAAPSAGQITLRIQHREHELLQRQAWADLLHRMGRYAELCRHLRKQLMVGEARRPAGRQHDITRWGLMGAAEDEGPAQGGGPSEARFQSLQPPPLRRQLFIRVGLLLPV